MQRPTPCTLPCALIALLAAAPPLALGDEAAPPHIVFIMADDMGYGDPGCYNPASKIPTPSIDRLAREGMRFTDAHAPAAVCVPTRYGLLTGRYPMRMRRGPGPLIEAGRMTLASLLKKKGYATGCVGKWHLGFEDEKRPKSGRPLRGGPLDHGFDYYHGIPASLDIPPYYYIENDRCVAEPSGRIEASSSPGWSPIQGAFWRAGGVAPGFKHDEVLGRFTDKAVAFLRRRLEEKPGQPLFLYLALAAPHTPWLPGDGFEGTTKAGMYGDFTRQVDHAVGKVLDELDRLRVSGKTLLFFTSDNGPVWYDADTKKYGHSSTGPLRGMKGDAWEAGHRMPFLARWPGRIAAGTVSDQLLCLTDMLATLADVVGQTLPADAGEDSFSVLPALLGGEPRRPMRDAAVFESSSRVLAIRQGRWKLIPQLGSGGFSKPRRLEPEPGGPRGQLYDLAADLKESRNLYLEKPAVVERLTALLESYRRNGRSR